VSRSKGAAGSRSKGQSLRTCGRARYAGEESAEKGSQDWEIARYVAGQGGHCESSGARCLVASWNGPCWWSLDVVRVGRCAVVSECACPEWERCATVTVEPHWRRWEGKP